jgi:hypothetical protein
MLIDLEICFGDFLKKARKFNMFQYAFNVEEFIIEKYKVKGLSREQIFKLPLRELWPFIKDYKIKHKRYFWISKK